ncbi:MAG: restriction endonuclease [Cyanobacteria bacterium J06634_5]
MTPKIIELKEYQPTKLPADALSSELGEKLWRTYRNKGIDVQFPNPRTANQWEITSQGQIGYIPLSPEVALSLQPKVPFSSLFAMLEYAYNLKSFRLLEGQSHCNSLNEFYERFADVLARRILDRTRQGLYRTYLNKTERLSCLRGRSDITHQIRRPWNIKPRCHYQEQTADMEDNQILLWTLRQILQRGLVRKNVSINVRRAYKALHGTISLESFSTWDCIGRNYHRLNDDYRTLHALCRFFLDQTGPSIQHGDHGMVPFLVNMNQLFEKFVAEWLKTNHKELQANNLMVREQVTVKLSETLNFRIDLVLEDITTNTVRYVLDTKYKAPRVAAAGDVQQIIAYAETKNTTEAVLIYPQELEQPLYTKPNQIRVRSLAFTINDDIDQGGNSFINQLLT